jgi:methylthioribose-1-phosphate isomerase
MLVHGRPYRTIFPADAGVDVIDQTQLPFTFVTRRLRSVEDAATAISDMIVRGAPLIGVTAAYGLALAMRDDPGDANLSRAVALLAATRPTAVNLRWALERMGATLAPEAPARRAALAWQAAAAIADEDVAACAAIGQHGRAVFEQLAAHRPGQPLRVLTHCNAGWLACVDWGTALAPVYAAHAAGLALHVYVDETRPRTQGAALTGPQLPAPGLTTGCEGRWGARWAATPIGPTSGNVTRSVQRVRRVSPIR